MQYLKRTALAVLVILLLDLIKKAADNSGAVYAVFLRNLIANLQLLILLGVILVSLFQLWSSKFHRKNLHYRKAIGIFLLTLMLAEGVFYFVLKHSDLIPGFALKAFREYYGYYGRNQIEFDKTCSRYDPTLTYTLVPDTNFFFNNYEFKTAYKTNRLGLRDDNPSLEKPAIIAIGDSYTMGWGVAQQQTFSEVLQEKTNMKVLNAGISSYGTAREMMSLQRIDLSGVKYLIIQFCINDVVENETYLENKNNLPIMSQNRYDSVCNALEWRLYYYPFKYVLTILRLFSRTLFQPAAYDLDHDRSKSSDAFFKKQAENFIKIINTIPIDLSDIEIIVFDATGIIKMEQRFINALKDLGTNDKTISMPKNIQMLDVAPILNAEDFFVLDGHINAKGHYKIAELIYNKIRIVNNSK